MKILGIIANILIPGVGSFIVGAPGQGQVTLPGAQAGAGQMNSQQ